METRGGAGFVEQMLQTSGDTNMPVDRLDACIEKLSQRMDDLKARVYGNIQKQYRDFFQCVNDSSDLQGDLEEFRQEVQSFMGNLKEKKLAKLIESLAEQRTLTKRFQVTKATVGLLVRLQEAHTHLRDTQAALESCDLVKAAGHVRATGLLLDELEPGTENGCDTKIFYTLRSELRRKRSHLKNQLEELWRAAVFWVDAQNQTTVENELRVRAGVSLSVDQPEADVQTLMDSMDALGMLEAKMQHFAKMAQRVLFAPMLANPAGFKPVVSSGAQGVTLKLTTAPATDVKQAKTGKVRRSRTSASGQLADFYSKSQEVAEFLASNLLGHSQAGLAIFRASFWTTFVNEVCTQLLATNLCPPELQPEEFQQVLEHTSTFETAFLQLGISDDKPTALSAYVRETTLLSSNRRRQQLLQTAREMLLQGDNNTIEVRHETERGGLFSHLPETETELIRESESIFRLPTCRVSMTVHSLIELAYTTLAEMGSASPPNAIQLFYGVRDMFDLVRAIQPVQFAELGHESPSAGAIFYNDSFYIAHHLLSLGHQHKIYLPEELRPAATFIDMVPLFHKQGEEHLLRTVSAQRDQLLQHAAGMTRFCGTRSDELLMTAERALQLLLSQLGSLTKEWKGVLPTDVFASTTGTLMDAAFTALVDSILRMEDIAADDALALHDLMQALQKRIPAFFGSNPCDLKMVIPGWARFTQMTSLLELGLEDIVSCWRANQIVFTADELKSVIKALFQNTALRASCLAQLK